MKRKNYFKTFSVFFMLMLLSIGCQPESGSENEPAKKTFTIIYNANDGEGEMEAQVAEEGTEITLAENAFARDGYEFTGWNTAANGSGRTYAGGDKFKFTADITLFAQWVAENGTAYKVEHFQQNITDNDYTLVKTETMTGTTGDETAAKTEDTAGFTAKEFAQVKIAADDLTTVKIYYDRKMITLTLNCDNGTAAKTITGKFGADVKVDVPTKTGYTFAAWNPELPATFPAEDAQYTANWVKEGDYIITYKNTENAVNDNPAGYNVETETITLKPAVKSGYIFDGWYKEDSFATKVTEIAKGSAGNVTLYAKWNLETYSITYELNGGTNTDENPKSYNVETETITLKAATKVGYVFDGWYKEDSFATKVTEITKGSTGNIALYAKWSLETYTIAYILNDNETNPAQNANPAEYNIESAVTLADPTRRFYEFAGWYSNADFSDEKLTGWSAGEKTGDIMLYAKWEMTLESLGLSGGKIVLTDDISEETLRAVAATILANPDENIILDLGGTTITEIPDKLFKKLNEYGYEEPCENLVGIILPKKLKSIGEVAFEFCIGLTEVEIPSGTTSIGDYAFCNTGIKSAKIPASIETVGVYAFSCEGYIYDATQRKIETVEFGGTLAQWQNLYVGKDDDSGYYGLQHAVVTTSDGVCCPADKFEEVLKNFGAGSEAHIAVRASHPYAFVDCITIASAMKSNSDIKVHLDLSKSKTKSDNKKFKDCTNLASIEFSTLDSDIMYNDFEGCTGLKSITIPANITTIGGRAFYNCTGLEEVTFLGNISAADQPFEGCTKLSKVNFPEGLTGIPDDICKHLTSLTSIEIPASVTEIGSCAFYDTRLTSVEIPAGVTRLGSAAFGNNESLTSVTINAVDIVLAHPFQYSANLKDVYYAGTMADWEALKNKKSFAESEGTAVEMAFSNAPLTTATIHCSDGDITP